MSALTIVPVTLDSGSECGSKSLPAEIPNNITKVTGGAKPLPPGQIKCNILKGKLIFFEKTCIEGDGIGSY